MTTWIHIASYPKSVSLHHELLPASSIAHVDRSIRVEHQAAFFLRFVEVEGHAEIFGLVAAENRALHLRFHLCQKLRAFSESELR